MEQVQIHLWLAKAVLEGVGDYPVSDQVYEIPEADERAADQWLLHRIRTGISLPTTPALQRALWPRLLCANNSLTDDARIGALLRTREVSLEAFLQFVLVDQWPELRKTWPHWSKSQN